MPPPPPAEDGSGRQARRQGITEVDLALLRRWALPVADGAKASRGTCLVLGGSALTPGAVLLAALGALRSGAGKVQVATAASAAAALAVAVPEALVVGLEEDGEGHIVPESISELEGPLAGASSVLIGPGCLHEEATHELLVRVASRFDEGTLVIDAKGLSGLSGDPGALQRQRGRAVITPNVKELAGLTGCEDISDGDLSDAGATLADRLGVVVAAKGADTWVATSDGRRWHVPGGGPGLSTAGSGDVLAGVVAGLAARADEAAQAAVHAVHAHAEAGRRLAVTVGRLGFLSRELLDEVPKVLDAVAP